MNTNYYPEEITESDRRLLDAAYNTPCTKWVEVVDFIPLAQSEAVKILLNRIVTSLAKEEEFLGGCL